MKISFPHQTVWIAALRATAASSFWPAAASSSSVYPREEWERLLPGCEQTDNFWDAAQCLIRNSPVECFDATTPRDLWECFNAEWEWQNDGGDATQPRTNHTGIVRDIFDTALDCFDPYHDCLRDRLDAALAGLPSCVRESTVTLAQCMMNNVGQCFTSCSGVVWGDDDGSSPFDDLNVFDLFTCRGIQRNLVQPMCDVAGCCEPCLDPLTDVAECVVNDVLDFGFLGDRQCEFACEAPPDTRRDMRAVLPQIAVDADGVQRVYEKCRTMVPGLIDKDQPSTRLAAHSNFFDCVMKESLGLYKDLESTTATTTDPPTASPATPSPTTLEPVITDETVEGEDQDGETESETAIVDETEEEKDKADGEEGDGEATTKLSANDAPSAAVGGGSHVMASTSIMIVAALLFG